MLHYVLLCALIISAKAKTHGESHEVKTMKFENLKLHEGYVHIPDAGIEPTHAWIENETWNGWAKPWLTLEDALRILRETNEHAGMQLWAWRMDGTRLYIRDCEDQFCGAGDFEEVDTIELDGVTLYALGNAWWVWDEYEPIEDEDEDED